MVLRIGAVLRQQVYRTVGDHRGGGARDTLLVDRIAHHGDIAARGAQLAQIGDVTQLVQGGILQRHRLAIQLAIPDIGIGGVEIGEAGGAVHLHQQSAHVGVGRLGRRRAQEHLGTRRRDHLPVGRRHRALVDHRGRDQHHPALAFRRDARALEHLDEAA